MKFNEFYSKCRICGQKPEIFSSFIGICPECVLSRQWESERLVQEIHSRSRKLWNLPQRLPRNYDKNHVTCNICSNNCLIQTGARGFCGIWTNINGKLVNISKNAALVHTYLDPLPTNCCNSYFCPENSSIGHYNFACFFYGCNFSCLGCQNDQHRNFSETIPVSINDFVNRVISNDKINCLCFFGGSPEPHLPFAIRASQRILKSNRDIRICWEWNGAGNSKLIEKAVKLSMESGGNAKFDLKCSSKIVSEILHGVSNVKSFENFERCYNKFYQKRPDNPVISATTLLVPGYVGREEVKQIVTFIAKLDTTIPYSLLVFHPDSLLFDLPITPKKQVEECYDIAKDLLENVHIGNANLLGYSI